MGIKTCGVVTFPLDWRLAGFWFCIEQTPDLRDPVTTDSIGQEPCVADAMEARWQDMDQEPPDELARGQAHDLHPVAALDAVVFPSERNGLGIRADEAVV